MYYYILSCIFQGLVFCLFLPWTSNFDIDENIISYICRNIDEYIDMIRMLSPDYYYFVERIKYKNTQLSCIILFPPSQFVCLSREIFLFQNVCHYTNKEKIVLPHSNFTHLIKFCMENCIPLWIFLCISKGKNGTLPIYLMLFSGFLNSCETPQKNKTERVLCLSNN